MDNNINDLIGYCSSCKEAIFIDDDYVKNNNNLWCIYCYNVEHNIVEELEFDRE